MRTTDLNAAVLALLCASQNIHHTRATEIGNDTSNVDSRGRYDVLQQVLGIPSNDDFDLLYLARSAKIELRNQLSSSAEVVTEGDESFQQVNARYTDYKRPGYIAGVRVGEEKDVVKTVNYARSRGIPFVARTGGHSLTTSLGKIQEAIVIDMRGLNSIDYDVEKQQMTVGGGVTTGEFANATFSQGMEVTVGSCPCTGVLGISLGAGIGRLQGKYGYLNDNMVSARLLLANGTTITASDSSNTDLFWALRGAGHNFGIVLEATYQVYPQRNNGKHYVVDFEFELDKVEAIFETMNIVTLNMPRELALFVIGRKKGATGSPTLNVNLVYSGPSEDAFPYISSFQDLQPVYVDRKETTWDALPWATYNGLNNILCTPVGWARFPIKNFYAANVKTYHIPTMRHFFDSWKDMNEKWDGQAMFSVMFESFPQQGVRERNDDATAFPWRHGSDHFLMMEVGYKEPTNAALFDAWLSEHQDAWIATSGYGRLQQYVNYGHGSKDPPEALYGYEPWRLEKLRALKEDMDPDGCFNGYQPFVKDFPH